MLFSSSSSRPACAADKPVRREAASLLLTGFLALAMMGEAVGAFLGVSTAARQIIAEAGQPGEERYRFALAGKKDPE